MVDHQITGGGVRRKKNHLRKCINKLLRIIQTLAKPITLHVNCTGDTQFLTFILIRYYCILLNSSCFASEVILFSTFAQTPPCLWPT